MTYNSEYIEELPIEKGFAEYYQQHILPHSDELEKARQKSLKLFIGACFLTLLMVLGLLYLNRHQDIVTMLASYYKDLPDYVLAAAFMISSAALYYPFKLFSKAVKTDLFRDLFKFFDGFVFKNSGHDPEESYGKFDLIPDYNVYESKGIINGAHSEVDFSAEELTLKEVRRSSKSSSTKIVFRGMIIVFEFNKKFNGRTLVKKDLGIFNSLNKVKRDKLERVKLEDPVFEKMFEVYSEDQIEARYLLSTSFMERLMSLSKLFDNAKLECSFFDNRLLLLVPTKKHFFSVPSFFRRLDLVAACKLIVTNINLIFEIIEILKLNQQTKL
jgi:hypothetical protein